MSYWPWWLCACGLAGVPLLHYLVLKRHLATSGRLTALNDHIQRRLSGEPDGTEGIEMSADEMAAALRAETAAEFGPDAVGTATGGPVPTSSPQSPALHGVFLLSIVLGAMISSLLAGTFARPSGGELVGDVFGRVFGHSIGTTALVLGFSGLLVGFGARMAGGCSTGHGLVGTSRLEPGSILATASWLAAAVGTSLLLRHL